MRGVSFERPLMASHLSLLELEMSLVIFFR
jgi:hypothetical protein